MNNPLVMFYLNCAGSLSVSEWVCSGKPACSQAEHPLGNDDGSPTALYDGRSLPDLVVATTSLFASVLLWDAIGNPRVTDTPNFFQTPS